MQNVDRLSWAAGIVVRAYGVRIGIRSNRPEWLARLKRYLPHASTIIQSPVVDRAYAIVIGGTGVQESSRRSSILYCDNVRLFRSLDIDSVLDRFESDLRLFVAELAHDRVFVHAGVVAWEGKAIVIPGRSFSGKSTLVAELLRAGATYYSDEYAVFDKFGRVHPFPKDLEMRTNDDWKQTRHAAASFGGQTGVKAIPVGKILVTRYKTGSRWRPRHMTQGKALLALLANTVSARRQPEKALPILQKVVAAAETFQGIRGEAKYLIPRILEKN